MLEPQTVAVVAPAGNKYSETFIRAHIERLPAEVIAIYGGAPILAEPLGASSASVDARSGWWRNPFWRRHARRAYAAYQSGRLSFRWHRHKVQAVLAETGPVAVRLMAVCRRANLPLVAHFHGADAYDHDILSGIGQRYPELFDQAAAVVAVSRDMVQQLVRLGAPSNKVHYCPYGIDLTQFRGAQPANNDPRFLTVGRFVDKKAPHLTILAFREVAAETEQAQLIMIGDGPLMEACQQLVRALQLESRVRFAGVCTHDEVALQMRQSRAFVQHSLRPSYGDSEGTPVAILEASASGLPVIATRHAGIMDVIIEGETGLLVDETDVQEMAAHMKALAYDSDLAERLGAAGRRRIRQHYKMEHSIGRLWEIIKSTIK